MIVAINSQILAQILSYIYLLSFGHFSLSWNFKKSPNDNKYKLGLCVLVPNLLPSTTINDVMLVLELKWLLMVIVINTWLVMYIMKM